MGEKPPNQFEKLSADYAEEGFFREFWGFLKQNKKWWLLPILCVLMLLAVLLAFSGSAAAPFIYTLF